MKLLHWRKLYRDEAFKDLLDEDKQDLVIELLEKWTIKDWKAYAKKVEQIKAEEKANG